MNKRKTTNILLLLIVLPIIFWVLKLLSFIFLPLIFSMFLALLFLPLMRWFNKKKVPKVVSLILVIAIIGAFLTISGKVIQLSSKEIIASQSDLLPKIESKLHRLIVPIETFFNMERVEGMSVSEHYLKKININKSVTSIIGTLRSTLSIAVMTAFFAILLLAESLNFQKILHNTLFKQHYSSVKVFFKIEKDIITFIKVKFIISFFTGLGFTLACYYFDVSFPIFWGLFAFVINFVQMIGSVISVVLLTIFAFLELDPTSTLLFFIISITLVQVIMGGILEPVFMGKSFSINVITILIMLSFWGFIWGIPGMILSIPITVVIKIILEQFPKTKLISDLMSGSELIRINKR